LSTKERLDGPSASLYYQMAYIHMLLKNWDQSKKNFDRLFERGTNEPLHYYLAGYVAEKRNQYKDAYSHYLKAYKLQPNDSVIRARLEHFMNRRGYAENHPIRRRLAGERLRRARLLFQKNLVQTAYFELRRAVWLDSHLFAARRRLLQYYRYHGYFPEYLRELRRILRILPRQRAKKRSQYQLRLEQSIRQRRRKLYHKAGLTYPFGRRDIAVAVNPARVAVKDRLHPGLAETYQRVFRFYLDQTDRFEADQKGALLQVHSRVRERPLGMSAQIQVRLSSLGLTVLDFELEENGSNALDQIIQRAIQRLADQMPRWGQVIKQEVGGELFINLGKVDGVDQGDGVYIFARRGPEEGLRLADKKDQARFQGKVVAVDSHVAKVSMNSSARGVWFGEKDLVFVGPKKPPE
jgi:tetratricopeptide (TPR) repeat protein